MNLLAHALRYHKLGWAVLPVGLDKKPAVRTWKQYQSERPTEADLRRWFGGTTAHAGLAAVCGPVSNGLTVRDFDTPAAYERWAEDHPELASTLPTVRTGRGWHVYFHSGHTTIFNIDVDGQHEGELRGAGYVVLPPSRHESGATYAWTIPLPESGTLPFLDPVAAGILPCATERTQTTERAQTTERTQTHPPPLTSCALSVARDENLQRIIELTLPTGPGQRHRCIFELARALKAEPHFADAAAQHLRPIILEWHLQALAVIRTKAREETLADFYQAWAKVRFPLGSGPMDLVLEAAKSQPTQPEAMAYDRPELRLLVAICRELQNRAGDAPFFLGCRVAGRMVGVDHTVAWRWLGLLQAEGLLVLAERGRQAGRRAARYYYTGGT